MKRRPLLQLMPAALGAATLPLVGREAIAQPFQEGKHFRRIQPPLPADASGKVEVVEFFWYGCPACNAFEPTLKAWVAKLPSWVSFRHQHVLLREATRVHQRLWFTLTAMGVEERYRASIFAAMHQQGQRLETVDEIVRLLQPQGLDLPRFQSTWNSFDRKAFSGARIEAVNRQVAERYQVGGVPTLAIGGRFTVSVADAAGGRRETPIGAAALRLAEQLLTPLKPA